jgi:hypothetical protein
MFKAKKEIFFWRRGEMAMWKVQCVVVQICMNRPRDSRVLLHVLVTSMTVSQARCNAAGLNDPSAEQVSIELSDVVVVY